MIIKSARYCWVSWCSVLFVVFEAGLRAKNIWSTTWFAIWYDIPDYILPESALSKHPYASPVWKDNSGGTVTVNIIVSV